MHRSRYNRFLWIVAQISTYFFLAIVEGPRCCIIFPLFNDDDWGIHDKCWHQLYFSLFWYSIALLTV